MEDGGDWKCHEEDAAQDAAQCHHLAGNASGNHISVAYCGHGDDSPPVARGDAGKLLRVRHLVLDDVQERCKQCDGHAEEEEQETKLPGAPASGQPQRLQPQGVPGQPHDIENPQGTENTEDQTYFVQVDAPRAGLFIAHRSGVYQQSDVVWQNGYYVYQG